MDGNSLPWFPRLPHYNLPHTETRGTDNIVRIYWAPRCPRICVLPRASSPLRPFVPSSLSPESWLYLYLILVLRELRLCGFRCVPRIPFRVGSKDQRDMAFPSMIIIKPISHSVSMYQQLPICHSLSCCYCQTSKNARFFQNILAGVTWPPSHIFKKQERYDQATTWSISSELRNFYLVSFLNHLVEDLENRRVRNCVITCLVEASHKVKRHKGS